MYFVVPKSDPGRKKLCGLVGVLIIMTLCLFFLSKPKVFDHLDSRSLNISLTVLMLVLNFALGLCQSKWDLI